MWLLAGKDREGLVPTRPCYRAQTKTVLNRQELSSLIHYLSPPSLNQDVAVALHPMPPANQRTAAA